MSHSAGFLASTACAAGLVMGAAAGAAAERAMPPAPRVFLPPAPYIVGLPGASSWRRGTIMRFSDGRLAFHPAPVFDGPLILPVERVALRPLRKIERLTGVRALRQIEALVFETAPDYGLDPLLVLAVIAVESAFEVDAVSPRNARGLMQLIPGTARRFGVKDAFDPVENVRGGMAYLRWLLSMFKGDLSLALAAYNAGERAVERHGGVPPYLETHAYLKRIRRLYDHDTHPYDPAVARPSNILAK
jgi:soluble lytic murein transglycosylase-like protein